MKLPNDWLTLGPSNFVNEVQPPSSSSSSSVQQLSSSPSVQQLSSSPSSEQQLSSSSIVNEPRRQQLSSSSIVNEPRRQQGRRAAPTAVKKNKNPTIAPPHPWATEKRCQVYSLNYLLSHGYRSITGNVKCSKCEHSYDMSFDLEKESSNVLNHFRRDLFDRAPDVWMNPILPDCIHCHQTNALRPVIEGKKRNINWLFLFLGQMLGCCTGEQLKYFCKHNTNHRTAAKNRLVYLVYSSIFNQLIPTES